MTEMAGAMLPDRSGLVQAFASMAYLPPAT